jgi:hypothetical protein
MFCLENFQILEIKKIKSLNLQQKKLLFLAQNKAASNV